MKDKNNNDIILWAFVIGAALGVVTVMLLDKGKRNELKTKVDNFVEGVDDLKKKGKEKVESEIDKTKSKIRKMAS